MIVTKVIMYCIAEFRGFIWANSHREKLPRDRITSDTKRPIELTERHLFDDQTKKEKLALETACVSNKG